MITKLRQRFDSEAGLTLVELIITIAILGIAIVALLSALSTAIIVSDVHKRQATAEGVLGSWAETLKSRPYDGTAAAATSYAANAPGVTVQVPAGYTTAVVVKCDGDASTPTFDGATDPPCTTGLEQLTLTVSTVHGVSKETAILKRAS